MNFKTRLGLAFWGPPARHIFAVPNDDVVQTISSSDESDGAVRQAKTARKESLPTASPSIFKTLMAVEAKVNAIDDAMSKSKILDGVKKAILESFQCCICHSMPMTPLPIASTCCQRIIGCATCVNEWFANDDEAVKHCPMCNAEKGKNRTIVSLELMHFCAKPSLWLQMKKRAITTTLFLFLSLTLTE